VLEETTESRGLVLARGWRGSRRGARSPGTKWRRRRRRRGRRRGRRWGRRRGFARAEINARGGGRGTVPGVQRRSIGAASGRARAREETGADARATLNAEARALPSLGGPSLSRGPDHGREPEPRLRAARQGQEDERDEARGERVREDVASGRQVEPHIPLADAGWGRLSPAVQQVCSAGWRGMVDRGGRLGRGWLATWRCARRIISRLTYVASSILP
jgi:hypothetical protein